MRRKVKRRSDAGIIVLHWGLATAVLLAASSGLRIMDPSGRALGDAAGWLLPSKDVWTLHMEAGLGIAALAAAYAHYVARAGLGERLRWGRARLAALRVGGAPRWGAINLLLHWSLFGLLAVEVATGVWLYLGHGGAVVAFHRAATWAIGGLAVAHVAGHLLFGGLRQLARVFRPAGPRGPAPAAAGSIGPRGRLALGTAAVAAATASALWMADRLGGEALIVARIDRVEAERPPDAAWDAALPIVVHTQQGANFGGTGEADVEVRGLHDDRTAWFSFAWADPTRSLKQAPLLKTADGWAVLRREGDPPAPSLVQAAVRGPEPADAGRDPSLSEDKFAVMLATSERGFGPGAFHVGPRPLDGAPPSSSGEGLHYREDGAPVEMWLWHAASLAPDAQCEHVTVGAPAAPTPAQILGRIPYKGGIRADAPFKPLVDNVAVPPLDDPAPAVLPLRLPRFPTASRAALGPLDLGADHGEADGARWSLTEPDSVPYSAAADAALPVGTLIPGVVTPDGPEPGPGDLRCAASWRDGRWRLVASRRLDARAPREVPIAPGALMWVSAFDHAPARHTRHMRPVALEFRP